MISEEESKSQEIDINSDIIIECSEKERIKLPEIITRFSAVLFKHRAKTATPLRVPQISSSTMKAVSIWCSHFASQPIPRIEKPLRAPLISYVGKWVINEYLNKYTLKEIYKIQEASLLFQITSLFHTISAYIATNFIGNTVENIRLIFGIKTDLSLRDQDLIDDVLFWGDLWENI